MGVKNLWYLLTPTGKKIKIENLKGQKLAIDISIWVLRSIYGQISKGRIELKTIHLTSVFTKICNLLQFGILPVIVFDGIPPNIKKETLNKRAKIREHKIVNLKKLAEKYILKTSIENKEFKNKNSYNEKAFNNDNYLEEELFEDNNEEMEEKNKIDLSFIFKEYKVIILSFIFIFLL